MPSIALGSGLNHVAQSRLPPQLSATTWCSNPSGQVGVGPVVARGRRLGGQQPRGLRSRAPSCPDAAAHRPEPVPRVDGLRAGLLVVAVGERRRARRPRVAGVRVERAQLRGTRRTAPRQAMSAPSRSITSLSVVRQGRVVGASMPGRRQQVAVVEVVVVELVRPERRREPDDRARLLVVHDAARVALLAPVRLAPLAQGGQRVLVAQLRDVDVELARRAPMRVAARSSDLPPK